jgi:hypothetical protein
MLLTPLFRLYFALLVERHGRLGGMAVKAMVGPLMRTRSGSGFKY